MSQKLRDLGSGAPAHLTDEEADELRRLWNDLGPPLADLAAQYGVPLGEVERALGEEVVAALKAGRPVYRVVDPAFTAEQERSLRADAARGVPVAELARRYGFAPPVVEQIVRRGEPTPAERAAVAESVLRWLRSLAG